MGFRGREKRLVHHSPGSDYPDNFPPDDSPGSSRILNLVTDCDPVTLLDEFCDVAVHRMAGYSCERDAVSPAIL
ncbi:MAG: hypothetical protein A4E42_02087 [Methanoregulaceae archaeon PtaU1.Bin222]|nr:MAG: hypothetical protein A4E42_02087 [Methanoregulaceae archaeon PtaU1.Bin222]